MVSFKYKEDFEECWMRSGYERITGSLSNYDDDHNDNFKKQFVLWAKLKQNNSSARASCFLYISLTSTARLRQDTSADATFYRGRGHTTTNSPFSFWTWILRFLIIQLQEKSPAFHILHERVQIYAIKFERTQTHFLATFSLPIVVVVA